MPTKSITLSMFIAAPHTQLFGAYNSPIFESHWQTWRPFAPQVEPLYVTYYGNHWPSRPNDFIYSPSPYYDYGYMPFETADYPIDSVLNRAQFTPGDGFEDGFFTLHVKSAQPYRRRTIHVTIPAGFAPERYFDLHEYCIDVEVDYPEFYLTRDYGFYNGQGIGRIYTYPGELFNIDLEWGASVISPEIINGVPDTVRIDTGLHFRGGVQEFVAYVTNAFPLNGYPYESFDGNGNKVVLLSGFPATDYNSPDVALTGLKAAITDPIQGTLLSDPLYKTGWSIEPTVAEHGWPVDIGILENANRYGFTALAEPGEQYVVVLPHQYSHLSIKRTYFTKQGRMLIVGKLSFDTHSRFGFQAGGGRRIDLALPEQRTAMSVDGPFTTLGASQPIEYATQVDDVGNFREDVTLDASKSGIRIYSFSDLANVPRKDISARPPNLAPTFTYSRMVGSGLSLFPDRNNATFATWWQSTNSYQPYRRFASRPYLVANKKGEKWLNEKGITETQPSPQIAACSVPETAMRFAARFTPTFQCGSYFEWAPTVMVGQPLSEEPQSVTLKFFRAVGYVGSAIGSQHPETFTVAELDYLPFGHMPVLSSHEYQQHARNTRLAGSTLWLTNGIDGCWESNDLGATWSETADWAPAFESPFVPLDVCMLPSGPLSWGVLALALPAIDANPVVYFRRTHDGGKTWDDAVEVGELSSTAWVWGCALFSGHHHKQGYLLITNSDRLMWVSHSTGTTWTAIEPPEES